MSHHWRHLNKKCITNLFCCWEHVIKYNKTKATAKHFGCLLFLTLCVPIAVRNVRYKIFLQISSLLDTVYSYMIDNQCFQLQNYKCVSVRDTRMIIIDKVHLKPEENKHNFAAEDFECSFGVNTSACKMKFHKNIFFRSRRHCEWRLLSYHVGFPSWSEYIHMTGVHSNGKKTERNQVKSEFVSKCTILHQIVWLLGQFYYGAPDNF